MPRHELTEGERRQIILVDRKECLLPNKRNVRGVLIELRSYDTRKPAGIKIGRNRKTTARDVRALQKYVQTKSQKNHTAAYRGVIPLFLLVMLEDVLRLKGSKPYANRTLLGSRKRYAYCGRKYTRTGRRMIGLRWCSPSNLTGVL